MGPEQVICGGDASFPTAPIPQFALHPASRGVELQVPGSSVRPVCPLRGTPWDDGPPG
jgi:hypothetical protein